MTKPGAPKYYTRRNPQRPTLGPIVARISEIVRGRTLMPWQKYVANVALELDPAHPGELFYTEGDVTVPRQAGKSDLVNALHTGLAIMFRDFSGYMTAQTGKDAGKRWRSLVQDLGLSAENRAIDWKINKGKGSEEAWYTPNRSLIAPFAPTHDALHGDHNNLVTIDEQWAFSLDEGVALETAAKPGFLTPLMVMLLRVSTMGTANSTYMNRNIELGRLATRDPAARRFYFEWSADEKLAETDPYGDATLAFHPAVGHTQSTRRIRDLGRDMPLGEWRRSFLNLPTATAETIIDLAAWDALRWNYDPNTTPPARYKPARPEDIVLAFDVARDGSAATIYAAWLTTDNDPAVEIVQTHPGTEWLAPVIDQLSAKGYRAIITDDSGPNRTVLQELGLRHVDLNRITVNGYAATATACQTLLDRIRTGGIEHDGAATVIDAINNAAKKDNAAATMFDPAKSAGPIDALRALAFAQSAAANLLAAPAFQIY